MRVIHTGDIHVRNGERFEEYKIVLDNFIEEAKKIKPDRIALLGDIFNSNTTLSPESTKLVYDFINQLSLIAELDVIAGNHDGNVKNLNRMNAVELIAYLLKENERVHYYAKSGLYDIDEETVYGVFGLYDDKSKWPIEITKQPGKVYIALYHGPLSGVKLDNGTSLASNTSVTLFSAYDYVWLADIHKRQFLDPATVEIEVDEDELERYRFELDFEIIEE